MSFCGCNIQIFDEVASGGLVAGGSAKIIGPEISTGGCRLGGSSIVDNYYDVYDGYAAVWGLDESGNGTAGEFKDHSRNHLNGTGGSPPTCPSQGNGIDCLACQDFAGRQFISFPVDEIGPNGFTVMLWANIASYFKQRTFFTRGFSTPTGDEWAFTFGHSFLNQVTASVNTPIGVWNATGPTRLMQNWWYLFAAVWQPNTSLSVYVNGVLDKTIAVPATMFTPTTGSYASRFENGGYMEGSLQEIRLIPAVVDAANLTAIYQAYCGSLVTVGPEQQFPF